MTRVSIYIDYCKNDLTLAAIQVADWLLKLGIDVVFVIPDKVKSGIHPYWDKKVYSFNNSSTLALRLVPVDYIFWFTLDVYVYTVVLPILFANTKFKEPKNILFPCWQQESFMLDTLFVIADKVVFLSDDNFYWFDCKKYKEVKSKFIRLPLVAANKVIVPKKTKIKGKLKLLITLSKWIFEDDPYLLEHIVRIAVADDCDVTILLTNSVNREVRKSLKQMQVDYGIKCKKLNYYAHLGYEAAQYDLIYVTDTRYACGAKLSLIYPSGTPIAAYRVPPATSFVHNLTTGYLLNCGLETGDRPIGKVYDSTHIQHLLRLLSQKDIAVLSKNIHSTYGSMQKIFQETLNAILS